MRTSSRTAQDLINELDVALIAPVSAVIAFGKPSAYRRGLAPTRLRSNCPLSPAR